MSRWLKQVAANARLPRGFIPVWLEWQTRVPQKHVLERAWGFKSLHRDQLTMCGSSDGRASV